jgi:5-methylcytosine-specific restriction enzyme A
MSRLSKLPPRLGSLPPRVGYDSRDERARDRHRSAASPWRKWYKTSRWRSLRMEILLRDHFTCKMCGRVEGRTSRLVCDHIKPHRGNESLFWDQSNLQTLCADPCHNSKKQQEEQGITKGVWD